MSYDCYQVLIKKTKNNNINKNEDVNYNIIFNTTIF